MKDKDDKTDIQFRKLFRKTGLESPSVSFTDNVMGRIAQLDAEEDPVHLKSLIRRWGGNIGIGLLAVMGIGIMYFFGVGIFPETFKPILKPVFGNMFNSFKGIFDSVEVSPTTIAIILGFALLVLLERLLSRFRSSRHIHLTF